MTYRNLGWDILRIIDIALALWLAALLLRLSWTRRGTRLTHPDRPQFLTYLSYAGALGLLSARRIEALGDPPDWHLFAATVIVIVGLVGVMMRIKLTRPGRDSRQ
jgi:hypothetical protein